MGHSGSSTATCFDWNWELLFFGGENLQKYFISKCVEKCHFECIIPMTIYVWLHHTDHDTSSGRLLASSRARMQWHKMVWFWNESWWWWHLMPNTFAWIYTGSFFLFFFSIHKFNLYEDSAALGSKLLWGSMCVWLAEWVNKSQLKQPWIKTNQPLTDRLAY